MRVILQSPHNFGDLLYMSQIVKRPLVQYVLYGNLTELRMSSQPVRRARRQLTQVLDIQLALLLEVIEGIFRGAPR